MIGIAINANIHNKISSIPVLPSSSLLGSFILIYSPLSICIKASLNESADARFEAKIEVKIRKVVISIHISGIPPRIELKIKQMFSTLLV